MPMTLMEMYNNAIPQNTPVIPATNINIGSDNFASCKKSFVQQYETLFHILYLHGQNKSRI